jgi:DNA-binding PadR family transcriptional regulator
MEPRTTDDVSNTNRCHCGAAAEADGGVRWFDLSGFERDLLVEIYQLDQPSGQAIRGRIEAEHGEDVKAGRLYPNLDGLVDYGLIDKGEQNLRTNYYQITNDGRRLVEDTARYFESIGATSRVAADGGREQTAVDVEDNEGVLSFRVEYQTDDHGFCLTDVDPSLSIFTHSDLVTLDIHEDTDERPLSAGLSLTPAEAQRLGLSAVRESIYELKDDLEAERQERRLDPADQEAGR